MTGKTKLVTRPILPMLGISASIVTCVFDKGKPKFCTLRRREGAGSSRGISGNISSRESTLGREIME